MKPERVDPNPEHPHTSEASGGTGELKIQHFLQRLVRRPKYTFSYTQKFCHQMWAFPQKQFCRSQLGFLLFQLVLTLPTGWGLSLLIHIHACARAHTHAPVTYPKCLNSWLTRSQSGFPTFPSSGPGKHLASYYSFTIESTTNEQKTDRSKYLAGHLRPPGHMPS